MERSRSHLAGAIYGQILATSLVATLSEDESATAGDIFFWVGVTMLVFWAAHVYANWLARQVTTGGGLSELGSVAAEQWPMAQAAAPALGLLLLGWAGVYSRDTAVDLAIAAGIISLTAWGVVIARRADANQLETLATAVISAGFGLLMVGLKILVH
ncbi:MAG TPA: hypothetical protein VF752_02700 [Thermoleophilaceae bacterium]